MVSEQRALRNSLSAKLSDDEAKSFSVYPSPQEKLELLARFPHLSESHVFGSEQLWLPALSTMAMGDANSTEFGECAHVSIGLRSGALREDGLVTLYHPLPRGPLYSGDAVDDAATLEAEEAAYIITDKHGRKFGRAHLECSQYGPSWSSFRLV